MSQGHNAGECINCGKPVNIYKRNQMLAGMCFECLEKESKVFFYIPTLKVFDMDAEPVIRDNKAMLVVKTICDDQETTKQVDSKQLRELADYLDYNTKLARINKGKVKMEGGTPPTRHIQGCRYDKKTRAEIEELDKFAEESK